MSTHKASVSSTSTRFAKQRTPKTLPISSLPEIISTDEPEVVSPALRSRPNVDIPEKKRRIEWDNDVKFHLSRHLLHLRRFRKMSQVRLATKIGASQSQIARIESGQENVTSSTVERMVNALDGRFDVSIAPAEMPTRRASVWWQRSEQQTPWTIDSIETRETGQRQQVRVTVGRKTRDTLPADGRLFIEEAQAS